MAEISPLLDPERPETMMRGTKSRLYPSDSQARTMDHWRRRNRQLWNVLLQLQQAAYSGENTRSKLGWRKTWAKIVEDDAAAAEQVYRHGKQRRGKQRKDGTWLREPSWIKEPGEGREAERDALKARLDTLKRGTKAYEAVKAQLRAIAGKPTPIDPELLGKIGWKWRWDGAPLGERFMHKLFGFVKRAIAETECDHTHRHTLAWLDKRKLSAKADEVVAWLHAHDGPCDCEAVKTSAKRYAEISKACQPRLLWFNETTKQVLQKLMARLKQHPQTHWIADLPSHAAQKTVSDMVEAVSAMLREKKKGAGGRNTGFPRHKPNHYAAGSVYFANTQLEFRIKHKRPRRKDASGEAERIANRFALVKLPNGVGWMECRLPSAIAAAHDYGEADLMGGRIWRQGEEWHLSCQWRVPRPERLPGTGRVAGVKIAAVIPITTCDDRGQTREYAMPPLDKALLAGHAAAGRRQARSLEARKGRAKKIAARKTWRRQRLTERLFQAPPADQDPPADAGLPLKIASRQGAIALRPLKRARLPLTPGFYQAAANLAKLEAIDRDIRDNWLHRTTTAITRQFDVIAVQKMEVAKMMKKPRAATQKGEDGTKPAGEDKRRSLKAARVMMRRAAMARIQTTLKYKQIDGRGADAYEELEPAYPTVQPCSRCGVIHPEMKQGKPVLRCAEPLPDGTICGNRLLRNRNAARVVARELAVRLKRREERA